MSLYIDQKYVSLLAPRLKQFKRRGEFLWNFRCPICGDSEKNTLKARGYVYKKKDAFFFMCHNCGASASFPKFLKMVDFSLYKEFLLDKFASENKREDKVDANEFVTKPVFKAAPVSINLTPISVLPNNHPAKKYLLDRKVPVEGLFYAPNFKEFIEEIIPDNEKKLYDEERIVIPFYDENGNLQGVQGRAVGASKVKYITMKVHEDATKLFGLDKIDLSKRIYVVEGPLDSLFLQNCLATMDASLYHAAMMLGQDKEYTFVYDNEPRNKQIVSNIRKTIDQGKSVCIWPATIREKDINEMVLAGRHPAEIQHIIDSNTFKGLDALMRLNMWEKTL